MYARERKGVHRLQSSDRSARYGDAGDVPSSEDSTRVSVVSGDEGAESTERAAHPQPIIPPKNETMTTARPTYCRSCFRESGTDERRGHYHQLLFPNAGITRVLLTGRDGRDDVDFQIRDRTSIGAASAHPVPAEPPFLQAPSTSEGVPPRHSPSREPQSRFACPRPVRRQPQRSHRSSLCAHEH